jgi:hypothetical protein
VGVGWVPDTSGRDATPFSVEISNFSAGPDFKTFTATVTRLKVQRGRRQLIPTPPALPLDERRRLESALRQAVKKHAGVDAIVSMLVGAIRRVADRNPLVGHRLLSVVIPKAAVLKRGQEGGSLAITGPSVEAWTTFQFWEAGLWNGITYGPTFVAGGAVASNFRSGPLLPKLGGMIAGDDSRSVSFKYPIAILRGTGGGLVGTTARGIRLLAAFTETELMESFRDAKAPHASPVIIETPNDFRRLLASVREAADEVFFNPNAEDQRSGRVRIAEILSTSQPPK